MRSTALERISGGDYEPEDIVQAGYFDKILAERGYTPQDLGFVDPPLTPIPDIAWAIQRYDGVN